MFLLSSQIKEMTHSLGMDCAKDLFAMLQHYHDLGHIIYFGGEIASEEGTLKDLVILDPKWLIEMLDRILTVQDIAEQVSQDNGLYIKTSKSFY